MAKSKTPRHLRGRIMTWLLIASLYVGYTPEIYTQRFASEQECIQAGNRLLITDPRYRYFCTDVKNK